MSPCRKRNRKCAAWILHHTCAQSYFASALKISGFQVKLLYAVAYVSRASDAFPQLLGSASLILSGALRITHPTMASTRLCPLPAFCDDKIPSLPHGFRPKAFSFWEFRSGLFSHFGKANVKDQSCRRRGGFRAPRQHTILYHTSPFVGKLRLNPRACARVKKFLSSKDCSICPTFQTVEFRSDLFSTV